MVIDIEYVWTAIDMAREEMAQLQFELSEKGRFSGEPDVMENRYLVIAKLSMNLEVLESLDLGVNVEDDKVIGTVLENIKEITKDTRQWH